MLMMPHRLPAPSTAAVAFRFIGVTSTFSIYLMNELYYITAVRRRKALFSRQTPFD